MLMRFKKNYVILVILCMIAFITNCSGCASITDVKVAQISKASAESILISAKTLQNTGTLTADQYKEVAKYYDMYADAQNTAIDARVAWLRAGKPADATTLNKAVAAAGAALTDFMAIAVKYNLVK